MAWTLQTAVYFTVRMLGQAAGVDALMQNLVVLFSLILARVGAFVAVLPLFGGEQRAAARQGRPGLRPGDGVVRQRLSPVRRRNSLNDAAGDVVALPTGWPWRARRHCGPCSATPSVCSRCRRASAASYPHRGTGTVLGALIDPSGHNHGIGAGRRSWTLWTSFFSSGWTGTTCSWRPWTRPSLTTRWAARGRTCRSQHLVEGCR